MSARVCAETTLPHFFDVLDATMSDKKPASSKSTRKPATMKTPQTQLTGDELGRVVGGNVVGAAASQPAPKQAQVTVTKSLSNIKNN